MLVGKQMQLLENALNMLSYNCKSSFDVFIRNNDGGNGDAAVTDQIRISYDRGR